MSDQLVTALWLVPLIALVLCVWRQTVVYRREVTRDRERFYGDMDRYGDHPRFRDPR